jgi:hypothetical protein
MRSTASAAAAVLLATAASAAPPAIPSTIWPFPVTLSEGTTGLPLCTSFTLSCSSASPAGCPDPLPSAFARYEGVIFVAGRTSSSPSSPAGADDDDQAYVPSPTSSSSNYVPTTTVTRRHGRKARKATRIPPVASRSLACLSSLQVSVAASADLSPTVNETYTLTVPSDGSAATLSSATQWGALRGLESFAQLVIWQGPDDAESYVITNAPVQVVDYPRFPYRGVLIDTSFNFLTVSAIEDVLDSMPVMKANFLHW